MDALSEAIQRVMEATAPRLVHVASVDQAGERVAFGTGFAFDERHLVCNSQILQQERVLVQLADGRERHARRIGLDPLYFLGFLELEDGEAAWREAAPVDFVPAGELKPGLAVVALGYPMGDQIEVTSGVVSGVDRTVYRPERIPVDGLVVTDAPIHPGNTGGPLLLLDGRVAGINGIPWMHGLGLAVGAPAFTRVIAQILERGEATHPWLGFSGQREVIEPEMVSLLGLPVDRGIAVRMVTENGPGARAGVQPLDLVVRVDDVPAASLGTIRQRLSLYRPGETARLTVLRGGSLLELEFPVEQVPQLRTLQ
ncbi:MAG: trypsin-like peptidase domain-containing protein [Bacillota bacterium]|nr:trypsin-like peptidase domain-containing protein [Bacillota bacterium]